MIQTSDFCLDFFVRIPNNNFHSDILNSSSFANPGLLSKTKVLNLMGGQSPKLGPRIVSL